MDHSGGNAEGGITKAGHSPAQARALQCIRIATAGLIRVIFFAAQAQAKPTIVWSPRSLAVELTAGETKTYTLSFAANLDQKNLDVRVVPGLAGLVTVTPARFPSVAKGVEQQVEITVHAPALEEAKLRRSRVCSCVAARARSPNRSH